MAASETNFCTLCQDDGTPNEAVRWCTECEVFLCRDCEKHHRKSRMFQNHKTMSINEYINLPAFVQKISSQCRDHKKKFELYCSFHACPCCVQCITDTHKKCQDMKPLSDIIKQVKVSATVQLLEKDLKDLKENFEKIIIYLKTRINTNTIQNKKAVVEIRSMRKSINDYLNTLEKEILDDLESKHQKLKSEINIILEQMEQQANQIGHFQNQFSKMTKHATELQIYVGLREIENTTSKAAKYIDDLEKGGQLNEKKLEVSISPVLRSVLEDVKSFGDVHMRTASSTLRLNAGRKDQAQYLLPQVSGIDKIKPSFLRKITIAQNMKPTNHMYMATSMILPNGRFLILDNIGKRILLCSKEGMFIRDVVTLTGDPKDVCFVKDHTVAVTLGSTQQTVVVDVEKNKVIKINLSHKCDGVASDGQILVISSEKKSTTVNLKDMSHTILEGVGATYISLFNGNIYCASYREVCCYKSTGELLWTLEHDDFNNIYGLTLDTNGFIYVASRKNKSIVVVSPDGKTCKTILTQTDGIKQPWAIAINRETGIMLVLDDDDGTAHVYKI